MIVHTVQQGTQEWHQLRAGIPTASCFDRILTPTGKRSGQADAYLHLLLAERIMGRDEPTFESQAMLRGKHMEDEAVSYYEMMRDLTTDPAGFCTTDDGRVGCSPDRLVYPVGKTVPIGGLEIKCPNAGTHMGYYMTAAHAEKTYRHQVQGCLWVTGLQWWDILSYHPDLPPALVRVEPDLEWQEQFSELIQDFCARLDAAECLIAAQGHTVTKRIAA